ncbi:hypothetical protein QLL94_gp38 [Pectobacterium phage PP2]|uniref:Uncharacterized protein n=1 Tax=Pectobacterium phage PP2 TaxID=1897743 RepID=A0A1W5P521_9CAUD|nr:hypothetical protein QLL94_gp38 [Pectobacterium phage PP2]AOT25404.1 hypothetical protein PP2_038 [Pectobacterium phage PP2]
MAEGSLIPTVANSAIERPTPIQISTPLSVRTAASGAAPTQATYGQAASNSAAGQAAIAEANQNNIRAMSAFSGSVQNRLKKMQEDNFAEGYLRFMQGQSMEDIQKDNPFKGIFGDGGAVLGARAAQQESTSAALLAWVNDNRGDLSQMSVDAQRKAVADYAGTLGNTGSPESDAMIAQGAMKQFPAIMDNLTRMSEAENQRKAAIAQADTLETHAQGLAYAAKQVATGQMAQEHYDLFEAEAMRAAAPLPGQSLESYRATMQGNLRSLVKHGQFELANTMRAKVLDPMLTPEERMELDEQMKQSNASWLLENPVSADFTEFSSTLPMQIQAGRYSSEAQLAADIDRFNVDYKVQTGSMSPFMDNKAKADALGRYQAWRLQEDEKAAKVNSKLQDENTKRTIWLQGFAHGSPSTMSASGLDSRQKAAFEAQETQKFFDEPGTQSANNLGKLAVNGYTVAPVKEKLSSVLGLLKGGGIPKTEDLIKLQTSFLKFKSTSYGMGAAEAYFGDDLPLMLEMENMDMSKRENQQYLRERALQGTSALTPTQETVKTANDLVEDQFKPGWWSRTFGDSQAIGIGLETSLKQDMKTQTANVMAQYPNMQEEDVLKMAAQRVRKGTSVVGNMLVTGTGSQQLFGLINSNLDVKVQSPSDPRLNGVINNAVRAKVNSKFGFNVASVHAFPNGTMYVTVTRDDGNTQNVLVSAEEAARLVNEKAKASTAFDKTIREGTRYDAYGTSPGTPDASE